MLYNGLVLTEELAMGNNQENNLVLSYTDAEREEIGKFIDASIEKHSKRIREDLIMVAKQIKNNSIYFENAA